MSGILAAFLANISFALADNANGLVAKKNSPLKIAFWACFASCIIFLIPAIIFFGEEFQRINLSNLAIMLSLNVLVNLAYLFFVTSMNKGSITLTGVIGGSFPAITTLIALWVFKEQVSIYQLGSIILIFIGIVFSSMNGQLRDLLRYAKTSSIIYALGAFLFWGIYFAFIRISINQIGWFLPQYSASFVGLVMFYLIAIITKDKDVISRPKLPLIIVLLAFLQVFASVLFNYSISKGQTSIVAPIAGSSPVVFVIIAYFLFKEKLNKKQWLGILSALIGIIGLSFITH